MTKIISYILSILLLLPACKVAFATEYYVTTGGNDTTGDGSVGNSWLTLAKACTSVAAGTHTINLGAGTFTETAKCELATGVSILGVTTGVTELGLNQTTKLVLGYDPATVNGWIELNSAEGTNGNQSISYVEIDGDLRVNGGNRYFGVYISGRSNVDVHHVNIIDHYRQGIVFEGRNDQADSAPTTYATGNKLRNSTVRNSGRYQTVGRGCVNIGGQDGLQIYNNNLDQTERAAGENGYVIKYFDDGYLKNVKIYNNTITKAPYDGSTFQFSIELWNILEGIEIYDNTIVGSIDIDGTGTNPASGYTLKIYGNTIGTATKQSQAESGIQLEDGGEDIFIYGNLFQNLNKGIRLQQDNGVNYTFDNIWIYNNLFKGVGYTGGTSDGKNGTSLTFSSTLNGGTWSNFYIYNNTFYNTYSEGFYALSLGGVGIGTNWYVKNNVIQGFVTAPIYSFMETAGSTIDVIQIQNNDMYGNGNSNNYLTSGITPTNQTISGNVTTDPSLNTGTLELTTGSPAIGLGLTSLGITDDYNGNLRGTTNDAGAYQFTVIQSIAATLGKGTYGGMRIQ